ncbi:cobyrinate a,c-diamide synthase [Microcoleus sp. FACHB-672]|uniref:cobyrinate a,c-diamide synthase n=1 Tax=Microcoleus sp. FACHB-672 TaxID=2692825 RepID=UPI0016853CF1|nr:cobyrinate a,c-diamide synthase [Microcoleus sp. FACHB-672]MBD2042934.1 cobyrinate a,c-diamide synthase [Microcoleus sp. FACHB-672]
MALVIAGERSGVGKTTVTLALLASLRRRGFNVQSFKVGPDYIDPMFHQYVTGRPCRNLDPVLTSEAYVGQCFAQHTASVEFALVEGVMGLFDGVKALGKSEPMPHAQFPLPKNDFASTAHIARLLQLPVLLVIDCSRLSGSVAAITHGYRSLDPRLHFAGIVLNRVGSDRHLQLLEEALEPLQLPILGVLRRQDNITLPDRHLGLVPANELTDLDAVLDKLAHIGKNCFNWDRLLPLLKIEEQTTDKHRYTQMPEKHLRLSAFICGSKSKIRLGVAHDRAFNFYYQDNLDILESFGAELVFWSPLKDRLPADLQGLYFGGGFPEVFAEKLSKNSQVLPAVKQAIAAGMPVYAECGGLMYLCEEIVDFEGHTWQMVGALPATAVMGKRLTLGYRQATALQNTALLAAGETVYGHEFHRSELTLLEREGEASIINVLTPLYKAVGISPQLSASAGVMEGWTSHQLHASYIHLHWGACPEMPARFLQNCSKFNHFSNSVDKS